MDLIECNLTHAEAIRQILNDAILKTTALYDYLPRTPQMMHTWFETKRDGGFPILGVQTSEGELMGFASYGIFRPWPAYKYSIEHSLYVAEAYRRRGVGEFLLRSLIERAIAQDYHVMIGGIDADNQPSINLHLRLGFAPVGLLREVGYKFGRWLDLAFYQLVLVTPSAPESG
jgi:phosphinothricin acetyltransferase